jgi:hypothetical protein
MKKTVIIIMSLFLAAAVQAQGYRTLEIRGGYFNPKDAQTGLILGSVYGISFDERVSLGLGMDFFYRDYTKETVIAQEISESGLVISEVARSVEYKTTFLPISLNLDIRFPTQRYLNWYVGGSITYELLFNSENNYVDGVKEHRFYSGFGWMSRAGLELLIGSRSAVFLEAVYNSCKVGGNKEMKERLPVWKELNMTGLGFRTGVRLDIF